MQSITDAKEDRIYIIYTVMGILHMSCSFPSVHSK